MDQEDRIKKLETVLSKLKSVVVAYSGGLDSTFLLKTAVNVLGKSNVLAVTARSETYPYSEYKEARQLAKSIGVKHLTICTKELSLKNFRSNPVNRCYYCKKELFKKLNDIKKSYGFQYIIDGTNFDDLKDVRYGRKAAKELSVRSPLLEAKITKPDIRKYSKRLGLPTWDKPSFACLASRIPFNNRIEKAMLKNIETAENFIRNLGIRQVRVRAHGDVARVEVSKKDLNRLVKFGDLVSQKLRKSGFAYTSLDLEGYRTGSMHEAKSVVAGSGFEPLTRRV